jgi:hypothetical protein
MNKDYTKHLVSEHNAKISVDDKTGLQRIDTRLYNIPTNVGKLLKDIPNDCWFCVLERFEDLEQGKVKTVAFELQEQSRKEADLIKEGLENLGYHVIIRDNYFVEVTK